MLGFGDINPFPLELGGGVSIVEIEHNALLRRLAFLFDIEPESDAFIETYADAVAIATVWAVNDRLRHSFVPDRMLETLPTWEDACSLRPQGTDSDQARRAAVAAKLRGLAGNARGDIEQVAQEVLGIHFTAIVYVDPTNAINYWPGINPGPPGLTWASNRAVVAVRMSRSGLDDAAFHALRARMANALDAMLPAWMRFVIGVGSSFVANIGVVGQTFI